MALIRELQIKNAHAKVRDALGKSSKRMNNVSALIKKEVICWCRGKAVWKHIGRSFNPHSKAGCVQSLL